jgi:hypothetical protein
MTDTVWLPANGMLHAVPTREAVAALEREGYVVLAPGSAGAKLLEAALTHMDNSKASDATHLAFYSNAMDYAKEVTHAK